MMNDETLVAQFEEGTLPREAWTHTNRVRVAYHYLCQNPFNHALARLRARSRDYDQVYGIAQDADTAYHETRSIAWLHFIASTICVHGSEENPPSQTFLEAHPHLTSETLIRLFYSDERMRLPDASTKFLQPDLTPLPSPRGARIK